MSLRRLPNAIDVDCDTTKTFHQEWSKEKEKTTSDKKHQEKENSKRKKATSGHPSIVRGG